MNAYQRQLGRSLYRLGQQLLLRKQFEEARESFTLSLEMEPDSPDTCFELGNLLHAAGRHAEAAVRYAQAIALQPGMAKAWYNHGVVQLILRDLEQARECFLQALALDPGYAEAHNNLAILMQAAGQMEEAFAHYHEAARLCPAFVEPRYNLALALQDRHEFEQCAELYANILEHQADHVDARNNLANVLLELGRPDEARMTYEQVVRLDPQHPEANWNLGLAQLQLGEWQTGWRNYEWRFRQPTARHREEPLTPRWDGRRLLGGARRILLTAEQGLGDMLQFLRYIPEVVERGGVVFVECHAALVDMVARIPGVAGTVVIGNEHPAHDCWAPLLSLPGILQHNATPLTMREPYVSADPARVRRWAGELSTNKFKAGLVWSGNPDFKGNAKRSMTEAHVRSLTAGFGESVSFYCLQKGVSAVPGADLVDLHEDAATLEDAAAIIQNLDLVISVDTSIAHLAGALGRPVWTLLAFAADWRWMKNRADSPWYPSMRLFRQAGRGDWDSVIEPVRRELTLLLD